MIGRQPPAGLVSACESGVPVLLAVLVAWLGWVALKYVARSASIGSLARRMRASAGAKRAARDGARAAHDALPRASDALRDEVLACTAGEIAERVHAGALSAADVTAVYCGAAAAADAELRCNTEEFYEEALKTAAAWTRAPGGAPRLLDGVPISVKDQFSQRGADATCGLAAHVFAPEAEDGLLVELLRDAGAVPFVRTNVPQALLLPESDNAVRRGQCCCCLLLLLLLLWKF